MIKKNNTKDKCAKNTREIIAGINPINTLIIRDPSKLIKIFVIRTSNNLRIKKICDIAKRHGIAIQEVSDFNKLNKWFEEPINHQGIIAEVKSIIFLQEKDLYAMAQLPSSRKPVFMALDHVQDPRNLGACIRNAAAFGVDAVILPKNRSCDITPTVRKAASGGVELVPIAKVSNLYNCLQQLKEYGVWVVALAADNTTDLASLDLNIPLVLVLGAEDVGVQDLIKRNSDFLAKIPLQNLAIDSLNLSVAAGICLYEVYRQRQ